MAFRRNTNTSSFCGRVLIGIIMTNFKDDYLEIVFTQKAEYFRIVLVWKKKLSDTKTEIETLKTKIIQLELKQEEDKDLRGRKKEREKRRTRELGLFN